MKQRVLFFAAFICMLATLYLVSRQHLTWDGLVAREAELQSWLTRRPWAGFGLAFGLYVIVSLVPGTTGKAIVVGWLFGFWRGLVIVNVGLTVAAILSFLVSRYVCRDLIAASFGPRLRRADAALEESGPGYLFAARVLHIPFSVTSYVMGATRIRLVGFWWATQLGILPGNLVFVYAGAQAPSLEELGERGLGALVTPGLLVAFVAMSTLPLVVRAAVRRIVSGRTLPPRRLA